MKKKLSIIVAAVAVAVLVFALVGCTESLKQDAIATDFSEKVESNGGMAVVYGDYLYFINGYAGSSADNVFGETVKGAIARVEYKNGKPSGEAQIVVPKNVYGTDTKYGGIYIVDDYIYYQTPSVKLDKNGNPKTTEAVLMRTKVDGTDTKEVAYFTDHSIVFRVTGDKLTYIRSNEIHSIDLNDKKFADTTVDTGISSGYLIDDAYVYYVKTNEEDSSDQTVKVYPLAGGEVKDIMNATLAGETGVKYTYSLINVVDLGGSVKLFYSKTDNGVNTPAVGIYSCDFAKTTFAFDKTKEVRFTKNTASTANLAYTAFYKAGNYYLGLSSSKLDAFNADGTRVPGTDNIQSMDVGGSITVFDVEETSDAVYLWYVKSNALYKIRILKKEGEAYTFVEDNTVKVFSASYNSTYVSFEKIGSVIYYLNSSISDNAYYYEIEDGKEDTAKGKILGQITQTDVIAAF